MKRQRWISLLLIFLFAMPQGALAYSYGDPSKEDVAETFKEIVGLLSGDAPNWTGAQAAYEVRRSEIASHFGESVAVTLDQNIKAQKKDLFLSNYKAVLVMNLERRFSYAKKDINDYTQSKLLLAKAKGTFDVLRPYVEQKKPDVVQPILTAYDKALEALGNPGLFGVGQKPILPEEFTKQVDYIYATVKPLFPYVEVKAEAKTDTTSTAPKTDTTSTGSTGTGDSKSTSETKTTTESAKTTDSKNTSESKSSSETKSTEATNTSTASSSTDSDATSTSTAEAQKSDKSEGAPSTEATPSTPSGEAATTATETAATGTSTEGSEATSTTTSSGASNTDSSSSTEAAAAHAPMERTTKTNPWVSVIVIGGVILAGAGVLYFARKQGWV